MSTSACKTSISFPPPIILHKSGVTIDTTLADPVHHCPLVPSYHREVIRRRSMRYIDVSLDITFVWRPKTPSSSKTYIWLAERDDVSNPVLKLIRTRENDKSSVSGIHRFVKRGLIYILHSTSRATNEWRSGGKSRSWASIRFKDEVAPAQAEGRS